MRLLLPLGCCDHVKKLMSAGVSERLLLEGAVEIRLRAHAGAFLPARSLFVTQSSLLIAQPPKWTALNYFISNSLEDRTILAISRVFRESRFGGSNNELNW